MSTSRPAGHRTKLAFALDALAIASWAEQEGFDEDALAMRDFARKILPAESEVSKKRARAG